MTTKTYPWFVKVTETGAVIKRPMIIPTDRTDRLKQMEDFEVTETYPKGPDIFLEALTPIELVHLRRKAQLADNKLLNLDIFTMSNSVIGAFREPNTEHPTLTSECRQLSQGLPMSWYYDQLDKPDVTTLEININKADIPDVNVEDAYPKPGDHERGALMHFLVVDDKGEFARTDSPEVQEALGRKSIPLMAAFGFNENPVLIVHPSGTARQELINANVVRLVHEIRRLDDKRKIVIHPYNESDETGPHRSYMAEVLCCGICVRVLAGSMVYEKLRGCTDDPIGRSVSF